MSTLLLFLPARSRLQAQGRATSSLDGIGSGTSAREYDYLLSKDGIGIQAQGSRVAAKLPHAEQVIAIAAESDLSWQRVTLPRAGRQMRSALAGMLEDSLLEDPEGLHFAIEPEAVGGDTAWVAVTSRAWLQQHLSDLESAQVFVDRIAPLSWPDAQPRGHFFETGVEASPVGLHWSHPEGVTSLPINGSLTRQLFPAALVQHSRWSAAPAVAAQAERWLGTSVQVLTPNQRALGLMDGSWNLRQFELAPRTRGLRALKNFLRGLMRRNWRPVRWALAGLVAVHLLGLNLLAWQQSQQVKARRALLDSTLTQAFPQVRVIRDAPIQMQRETDLLRASAGRASEQDLEVLLTAAAAAWPAERGPVDSLSFEPGRLQLPANGWTEAQIQQFGQQLRSEGWQLETREGRLTISRAARDASPEGRGRT